MSYIKEFRLEKGMNQADFAKAIGICQGTVSKLERDELHLNLKTLYVLRKKFNFDIDAYLENDFSTRGLEAKKKKLESFIRSDQYKLSKLSKGSTLYKFTSLKIKANKAELRLVRKAIKELEQALSVA